MKHFFSLRHYACVIMAIAFLLPALTSCSDEENNDMIIWDISPVVVYLTINDANGNNLLNPQATGSLFGKSIVAEVNGKTFEAQWEDPYNRSYESRAYMPHFYGFTFIEGYKRAEDKFVADPNNNRMMFGELDGATDQKVSMKIKIEGYTQTWDIKIDHRCKWVKGNPKITNTATLNGKEIDEGNIVITLH